MLRLILSVLCIMGAAMGGGTPAEKLPNGALPVAEFKCIPPFEVKSLRIMAVRAPGSSKLYCLARVVFVHHKGGPLDITVRVAEAAFKNGPQEIVVRNAKGEIPHTAYIESALRVTFDPAVVPKVTLNPTVTFESEIPNKGE